MGEYNIFTYVCRYPPKIKTGCIKLLHSKMTIQTIATAKVDKSQSGNAKFHHRFEFLRSYLSKE